MVPWTAEERQGLLEPQRVSTFKAFFKSVTLWSLERQKKDSFFPGITTCKYTVFVR